jgi:hypothetical protein
VICHHANGEGVSSGRDETTSESRVEKVRIVGDRIVETRNAEIQQISVLIVGINAFGQGIIILLE